MIGVNMMNLEELRVEYKNLMNEWNAQEIICHELRGLLKDAKERLAMPDKQRDALTQARDRTLRNDDVIISEIRAIGPVVSSFIRLKDAFDNLREAASGYAALVDREECEPGAGAKP